MNETFNLKFKVHAEQVYFLVTVDRMDNTKCHARLVRVNRKTFDQTLTYINAWPNTRITQVSSKRHITTKKTFVKTRRKCFLGTSKRVKCSSK